MARASTNSVSEQIKMKLKPTNPTPGLEHKDMLIYTKNEPHGRPAYYAVLTDQKVHIGDLDQELDGYYYFTPINRGGFWAGWILKDIAFKLEALNEAWNQRVAIELSKPPTPKKVTRINRDDHQLHAYD